MNSSPAQTSWRSEIDALRTEARGHLRLDLIRPDETLRLLSSVLVGDVMATALIRGVIHAKKTIAAAPKAKPTLCACCPRPVRPSPDLRFGIVTALSVKPINAFAFAVCKICLREPDLLERVTASLRQIWPDLERPAAPHAGPEACE